MDEKMLEIEKRKTQLIGWLTGRGHYMALDAMHYARGFHTGTRKDGITPEFDHQISIAQYLRTLSPSLQHPQETFAAVFLHDVREDFDVSDRDIRDRFGAMTASAVDALTKVVRGRKRRPELVFEAIAADPIASVVKGADRHHNHSSMVGVFSLEKQREYIDETNDFFFPMLKKAKANFPSQELVYENLKHTLKCEIALIEAIHAAASEPENDPLSL